jgi:AraC-like DNA-binding protein
MDDVPARPRSASLVRDPPARSARFRGARASDGYRELHAWELPFPEFPAFTHVNEALVAAHHVLQPHRHRHLEICWFGAGRAIWTVGGRAWRLRAGDFFIAWPGELHSGRPDPADPNRNFAVGFDPARLPVAALGAGGDLLSALAQLEAVPDRLRVIHGGHGAERILRRLLAECDAAAAATPIERALCLAQAQSALIELLVLVCRCALRQRAGDLGGIDGLEEWLRERLASPPDVGAMAAWAGSSPSAFTSRCRAAFGCTPLELVTRLRIEEAARRLAADERLEVSRVAADLGFCTTQYFATVFRRVLGRTPSAWRAQPGQDGDPEDLVPGAASR